MADLSFDTLYSLWPILIMLILFYVLLYRPQQKQQKRHRQMIDSLKKGVKVVTIGGLYGTIVSVNKSSITLRVAEKTEIKVTMESINRIATQVEEENAI